MGQKTDTDPVVFLDEFHNGPDEESEWFDTPDESEDAEDLADDPEHAEKPDAAAGPEKPEKDQEPEDAQATRVFGGSKDPVTPGGDEGTNKSGEDKSAQDKPENGKSDESAAQDKSEESEKGKSEKSEKGKSEKSAKDASEERGSADGKARSDDRKDSDEKGASGKHGVSDKDGSSDEHVDFDEEYEEEDYDDDYDEEDDDEYDEPDEYDDSYEDDDYDEYDDSDDDDEYDEGGWGLNLFTIFVMLFAAAVTAVYLTCIVRTVHVEGTNLYTSKQIAEQVIVDDTQLGHNSVYLSLLYRTPWAPKIPFVEKVRVSLLAPDSILIKVKDMDIAGYIPYAGKNLYFSADGIVLENSPLTVKNAAFVTGLTITKGDVGSKMEAENQGGLELVLEALEILKKYDLHTESIYLGKTGGVTMYLDQIKVQLGRTDYELKISKIAQIYPYLEGKSGTINMTNYNSSDENIILK